MRYLLALSFILASAGIPAVATYFPLETHAFISAIESVGSQAAAAFSSQEDAVQAPVEPAAPQAAPARSRPADWDTFPPQLI